MERYNGRERIHVRCVSMSLSLPSLCRGDALGHI
jgi:hypothetical protein